MDEQNVKWCCKICGYVAKEKGEAHPCAKVHAIVYNTDDEPAPRSGVDSMMRKIVAHVETELKEFAQNDPDADNIHPRMLCAITATNVILNIFERMVSDGILPHVKRQMMIELLHNISAMTMEGFGEVLREEVKRHTKMN